VRSGAGSPFALSYILRQPAGYFKRGIFLFTAPAVVLHRFTMTERARDYARWLVFPVVMGGTIGAAIVLIPLLGIVLSLIVTQTAALIVIAGLEWALPYRREWARAHGDVPTDLLHALVSGICTTQLARPVVMAGGVVLAGTLSGAIGVTVWPTAWPLAAQLALALVIAELPQYWIHRWQHEHDALWRFHATHHSAPRLYWLNAARFHPGDLFLLYVVGYLPLVMLGCSETVIMLFGLFDAVFGLLQHCNIDVRLGRLNWIFSMAEPHRWHHSRTLREANTNYGSNLIIWDLVFGSFFLPADRQPPVAIGIADMPDFPQTYTAQILSPLRWRQLKRERPASAMAA